MQVYVFIENSALVPPEKSNFVIFHEPTKCCFRYDQQTMSLIQVRCDGCNWSTRYLLCQDVILHQTVGINDGFRQHEQERSMKCICTIVTLKDTDQNVDSR